jgi:DNA-binding transcriptional MerR regulator
VTDHLSIGEVLSLLQDEFPDVTISKIRFLESQGLIDPERTPSGYRKFYESDIDRLRWILVQQREHFLPLKVIKDRLTDPDAGKGELLLAGGEPPPPPAPRPLDEPAAEPEPADDAAAHAAEATPASEPTAEAVAPDAPANDGAGADEPQPIWMADLARASATTKANAAAEAAQQPLHVDAGPTEVSLTAEELAIASGISRDGLRSLEQYGLLAGKPLGDAVYYDGDALLVATKAAGFLDRGIEARHLRMFKVAAEREAGFLEQLALPLLKQRNPQARRDAVAMVEELSALGHDLRAAMLRANLRRHLDQA